MTRWAPARLAMLEAVLTRLRSKGVDVDEPDDVAGVAIDVGHDGAAVGVGDEHDGPVDRADEVAHGGGVGGDAWPALISGSMTPSQLDDSANAP